MRIIATPIPASRPQPRQRSGRGENSDVIGSTGTPTARTSAADRLPTTSGLGAGPQTLRGACGRTRQAQAATIVTLFQASREKQDLIGRGIAGMKRSKRED